MIFLRLFFLFFVLVGISYASVGHIVLKKGDVNILRNQQKIIAYNDSEIFKEDIIETLQNSKVQVRFLDDTVITLGANSTLNVQEYVAPTQSNSPKAKFGFSKGTFKTITGKIGKIAPQNFTLQTKTATIGIRGTIVVGALGDSGDEIGCLQGSIEVKPLGGGEGVVVGAGERTFVGSDGSAPQEPSAMEGGGVGEQSGSGATSDNPPSEGEGGTQDDGTQEGGTGDNPSDGAQESADGATQSNLQETATQDVIEKVQSNGCGAGYVGTSPNCQPINTSYALPAYWSANLQAASTTFSPVAGGPVLTGYATSNTDGYGFKTDGSFTLEIANSGNEIIEGSEIQLDSGQKVNLTKSLDADTMTYKDINRFSVQNFDEATGWIQSENTVTNEYVSWGYWQVDAAGTPKSILNFWVGGIDVQGAKNYLMENSNTYTYTGKSIGYVYDSVADSYVGIDPTNNNIVSLTFDFGAQNPLSSSSYIQFQTNAATPEVWKLDGLTQQSFGNGTFSAVGPVYINGQEAVEHLSHVNGTFYGDTAQAVGGSFQATAPDKTAIGVFKAVK